MEKQNQFPVPLTTEELAELMPLVLQRNKAAQDKVIKHHLRLAFYMARKKARTCPVGKADDLIGEAFLLLTQAVENFPSVSRDSNITAYISSVIRHGLVEFLIRDNIIYTPNEAKEYAKILPMVLSREDGDFENPMLYEGTVPAVSQSPMLDVQDFIENSIGDEVQKMVIKMRLVDFSDKEIAETLKIRPDEVCRLRQCVGIAHKISERELK
jgi:RNA polymerase sigma factor (sigma-70 family)